jgi:hypothetical protein
MPDYLVYRDLAVTTSKERIDEMALWHGVLKAWGYAARIPDGRHGSPPR